MGSIFGMKVTTWRNYNNYYNLLSTGKTSLGFFGQVAIITLPEPLFLLGFQTC